MERLKPETKNKRMITMHHSPQLFCGLAIKNKFVQKLFMKHEHYMRCFNLVAEMEL